MDSAALVADKNNTKSLSLLGNGLCCFVGPDMMFVEYRKLVKKKSVMLNMSTVHGSGAENMATEQIKAAAEEVVSGIVASPVSKEGQSNIGAEHP